MAFKWDKMLGTLRESDVVIIQPQHIFADAAARDAYFNPDKLFELTTGLEVVTAGDIEKWIGETKPLSYDNANWKSISGTALSAAEIKTLYESNPDTNALIDAKLSILNHLSEDSNGILSDVSWTFPPGSIHVGDSIIESGGRIISTKSESTGNQGAFMIQLFDETQYYNATVIDYTQSIQSYDIQITDDTVTSPLQELNFKQITQSDTHLNAVRFKPAGGVLPASFLFEIRMNEFGSPIYSETILPSDVTDIGSGIFEVSLNNPSVFDIGFGVFIKTSGIQLLGGEGFDGFDGIRYGDSTINDFFPWLQSRSIPVIRQNIATENYVVNEITNIDLSTHLVTEFSDVSNSGSGAIITDLERTKLENILANCAGDGWDTGLVVTEHSPKNQTVDYTNGTYLIDGNVKTIVSAGTYDLEDAYASVNHYTGLTSYQHRFVILYVDNDEVIKSVQGAAADKKEVPDLPVSPIDSVPIALIEVKVDNGANPKNIGKKDITDQRNPVSVNTDERVRVDADDIEAGHLSDKLSNDGDITFTVVDTAGVKTIKADITSSAEYGELYMTAVGNQKLHSAEIIIWNTEGVSNGITVSSSNNRITISSNAVHKIEFSGSALIKRNETYNFYIYVNGTEVAELGERYTTIDNSIITMGFSRLLDLNIGDYVEIWGECSMNKDFDMSPGAAFSVVKL